MARPRTTLSTRSTGPTWAAETVAVRTVATKRLAASALVALVTRPEAIGPATRLTDREFWNRTRGGRLPGSRQRGTNERPMDRPVFVRATFFLVVIVLDFLDDPVVLRSEIHFHLGIVGVLVAIARCVLDGLRTAANVDVVIMLVSRLRCGGVSGHALGRIRRNLRIQRGR